MAFLVVLPASGLDPSTPSCTGLAAVAAADIKALSAMHVFDDGVSCVPILPRGGSCGVLANVKKVGIRRRRMAASTGPSWKLDGLNGGFQAAHPPCNCHHQRQVLPATAPFDFFPVLL